MEKSSEAEICRLKQKGISQVKLAEQFGVAEATISGIVREKEKRSTCALESGDPPEELTIKDAIDFTATAWKKANFLSPGTICNCWRKTGILPEGFLNELFPLEEPDQADESNITDEIQNLIMRLPLDQPMDAREYVIVNNNLITTEIPTNEEIIEVVKNRNCIEPEEEGSYKPISLAGALRFIHGILTFLEQQPDGSFKVDDSFIRNLGKLKKEINLKTIASKRQATLDAFICDLN
ncbi:15490_t:CDS:2 [Gigaspora rosea]|nr:15490_t:CDS:2 [Gigaspora rosea]